MKKMENRCMAELLSGEKAVVTGLNVSSTMRRRLQDMGLIDGTIVECVGKSPFGDPCAYLVRGTVIALRSEDAGRIRVKAVKV